MRQQTSNVAVPPAHTHHEGPLCAAWPWGEYDDSDWKPCEHRSCLDLVDEFCAGCEYENWINLDEADFYSVASR